MEKQLIGLVNMKDDIKQNFENAVILANSLGNKTSRTEIIKFLKANKIEYDEKYIQKLLNIQK